MNMFSVIILIWTFKLKKIKWNKIITNYAYEMSSKMQFILEPTLNYYLGSTYSKREPIGLKPYTLGLNFGIKF